MKYEKLEMNENDLINIFSKEDLEELLEIQINHENYEGAKVVKNAIEQYDDYFKYCEFDDYDEESSFIFHIDDKKKKPKK